jgi:hypothetical protein
MRILPPMPLSKGYETPSVDLNEEEGILEIFHPDEGHLVKESKITPESLILRCQVRPLARQPSDIHVQLTAEEEVLESALLYDKGSVVYGYDKEISASQWQGIALDYIEIGTAISEGESFSFQGGNFQLGKINVTSPLYVKPFRIEEENHTEHHLTLTDGTSLIIPPGLQNKKVLRPYGGYYQKGVPLEAIQQIYYSLTSIHHQTRIRLMSSEHLQAEESKGFIIMPPLREEEHLSLSAALVAGCAQISLEMGDKTLLFTSFHCAPLSDHPTFINVHFKPK